MNIGYVLLVISLFVGTIWAVRSLGAPGDSARLMYEQSGKRQPVDPRLVGCAARFYLPVMLVVLLIVTVLWIGG